MIICFKTSLQLWKCPNEDSFNYELNMSLILKDKHNLIFPQCTHTHTHLQTHIHTHESAVKLCNDNTSNNNYVLFRKPLKKMLVVKFFFNEAG